MIPLSAIAHQAKRLSEGMGQYLLTTGIDRDGFPIIAFPAVKEMKFSWVLYQDAIN